VESVAALAVWPCPALPPLKKKVQTKDKSRAPHSSVNYFPPGNSAFLVGPRMDARLCLSAHKHWRFSGPVVGGSSGKLTFSRISSERAVQIITPFMIPIKA